MHLAFLACEAEVRRDDHQVNDVNFSVMIEVRGLVPVWRRWSRPEGCPDVGEIYNVHFAIAIHITLKEYSNGCRPRASQVTSITTIVRGNSRGGSARSLSVGNAASRERAGTVQDAVGRAKTASGDAACEADGSSRSGTG